MENRAWDIQGRAGVNLAPAARRDLLGRGVKLD
jgi:hypothetical protein